MGPRGGGAEDKVTQAQISLDVDPTAMTENITVLEFSQHVTILRNDVIKF